MRDFDKDPKECACRDWAYPYKYTPGDHCPTCPMAHDGRTCICHWCRRLRGDDQLPQMISPTGSTRRESDR